MAERPNATDCKSVKPGVQIPPVAPKYYQASLPKYIDAYRVILYNRNIARKLADSFRIGTATFILLWIAGPYGNNWSQKVRLEALKVIIEIDQQAQSDGLSKIKAVNNDPVCIPRMDTAI